MKVLDLILRSCIGIKSGERLLVISDSYARSLRIAQVAADMARSLEAEVVLTIIEPRTHSGEEPPQTVAAAMKRADIIFHVVDTYCIDHTNARKEATEAGARFYETLSELPESYFEQDISLSDLKEIKKRSDKLAKRLTSAKKARLTTIAGTDITFSVKGRSALSLHPLDRTFALVPDYAEAAICPVEGTTNGLLVADASVQGWNYLLRQPLRLTIRDGKVRKVLGSRSEVKRFSKIISVDEKANNCAAEVGIGTSHIIPTNLRGSAWEYGAMGLVHVAVGRNNDIGGRTWSRIHNDVLMTHATVQLDDVCVLEDGNIRI